MSDRATPVRIGTVGKLRLRPAQQSDNEPSFDTLGSSARTAHVNRAATHALFQLAATMLLASLAPSATAGDIVVRVDPASIAVAPPGVLPVRVEMSDIRHDISLARTVYERPLGRIELKPAAIDLVAAIVTAQAATVLGAAPTRMAPDAIFCGLREFSIETPNTLTHWDIRVRIAVILRVAGVDREVTGNADSRTWIYPSQRLIEQVTRDALTEFAANLQPALQELLPAPPAAAPPSAP